jgi:hypothetical protein
VRNDLCITKDKSKNTIVLFEVFVEFLWLEVTENLARLSALTNEVLTELKLRFGYKRSSYSVDYLVVWKYIYIFIYIRLCVFVYL